jgi:hypothetical protein
VPSPNDATKQFAIIRYTSLIQTGDLGTTAKEIEEALETNFALANRWDCILLLDEADVFLNSTDKG